jgi:hypothetical protein
MEPKKQQQAPQKPGSPNQQRQQPQKPNQSSTKNPNQKKGF